MIVFLVIYVVICVYGMKFSAGKRELSSPMQKHFLFSGEWNDYMSKEKTGAIKGIFVMMVLLSHYASCYSTENFIDKAPSIYITRNIGQLMVTMFLFYSGYGIMESAKKKGRNYVVNMPVQRILKLLFDFDIAVLIFLLTDKLIGKPVKPRGLFFSFFAWDSIGNSCWYVFAILSLYVFSFIAFMLAGKRYKLAPLFVTVLTIAYMLLVKEKKNICWYNTVLCYVFGMWFSVFRDKFEKFVQRSFSTWAVSTAVCIAIFAFVYMRRVRFAFYEVTCLFFILSILLLSMKISVDNKILRKAGEYVFGVYILQRVPMLALDYTGFLDEHIRLSFVICLICTVVLAFGFDRFTKLTGKLFMKFKIKDKSIKASD